MICYQTLINHLRFISDQLYECASRKTLVSSYYIFKDVFRSFIYIRYMFFYIYIRCREFNAEFNKLIKLICHRARFFVKNVDFIWTFSHCYLSSPKVVTKH